MATNAKRQLRDWHQETSRALRAMPGFSNVPYYPASYFGPLSNFLGDMDRLFDQTWRSFRLPATGFTGTAMNMFMPKMDITSDHKQYTITAELPGLEERDVRLHVSGDGMLTISGEKRHEMADGHQNAECIECSYGAFERSLTLPDDVDEEAVEARFRNGVLTITCPRKEAHETSSRPIPIGSGAEGSRSESQQRGGASSERSGERSGGSNVHTTKKAA